MENYLECLGLFYDEKVKFLSSKDNFLKCPECENNKSFIESYESIILTCGGELDDKDCGIKLKIDFPKYLHYESEIEKLKKKLQEGINLSVINNYLDVSKSLKEQISNDKRIEEEIEDIRKTFNKININNKIEKIQKFYDSRITKSKVCKDLLLKISKEKEIGNKTILLNEYINTVKLMNKEYIEANNLLQTINPYHEVSSPIIDICSLEEDFPKKIKNKFKKDDKVFWRNKTGENMYGVISKKITKKTKRVSVKLENGKEVFVPIEQLILNNFEKNDPSEMEENEELVESDTKDSKKEKFEKPLPSINYYSGSRDNKWLSSFNVAEPFKYDGLEYPSVENAFHAQKLDLDDTKNGEYKLLFTTYTDDILSPNEAKKMGGKKSFETNDFKLRGDWDKVKATIMKDITREYYNSNPKFKKKLIETNGKVLKHKGFRIDKYWGETKDGGLNTHGKILMELRDEFK